MLGKSLLANIKAFSLNRMNIKLYSTLLASSKSKKERDYTCARLLGVKTSVEPGSEFNSNVFKEHDRIVQAYSSKSIKVTELPAAMSELSSIVLELSSIKMYLKGFFVIESFLREHAATLEERCLTTILQNIIPLGFIGYSNDFYSALAKAVAKREDLSPKAFVRVVGLISFVLKQNNIGGVDLMWSKAGQLMDNPTLSFRDRYVLVSSIKENEVVWLNQQAKECLESMVNSDFKQFTAKDLYASALTIAQFSTPSEFKFKVTEQFLSTIGKIRFQVSADMFALLLQQRLLEPLQVVQVMSKLPFDAQPMNVKISVTKGLLASMSASFEIFKVVQENYMNLKNYPFISQTMLEEYNETIPSKRSAFLRKYSSKLQLNFEIFSSVGHSPAEIADMEAGYSDESFSDDPDSVRI